MDRDEIARTAAVLTPSGTHAIRTAYTSAFLTVNGVPSPHTYLVHPTVHGHAVNLLVRHGLVMHGGRLPAVGPVAVLTLRGERVRAAILNTRST